MLIAFVDGSVTGGPWGSKKEPQKPIRNSIGWVITDPEGYYISHKSFDMGENPKGSGNTAEEFAVSSVLRWMVKNDYCNEHVTIYSDSKLTVGHLTGTMNVYDPVLTSYVAYNQNLMMKFLGVDVKWIPREKNKVADKLSKALQEKHGGRELSRGEVEELLKKQLILI